MNQFPQHETAVLPTDITVIEDAAMVTQDEDGNALASYKFVDRFTIRAHPLIVDALLETKRPSRFGP